MRCLLSLLLLLVLPNLSLGQKRPASKQQFLRAVRNAEISFLPNKGERIHQRKWYADSAAFAVADTIVFYNFYRNPIQNSSCSKATWDFYDTQYLTSELAQTFREPSTGTMHPDMSTFYKVSFVEQRGCLILKLANKFKEEYYVVLSVEETGRENKRFEHSKISLARLKK